MRPLLAALLLVATYTPPAPAWTPEQVEALIVATAQSYGVPAGPLIALGQCESGLSPASVGKAGERGVFQWLPTPPGGLWEYTPAGRAGVTYLDVHADVGMAAWAYTQGDALMAQHWVACWPRARGARP